MTMNGIFRAVVQSAVMLLAFTANSPAAHAQETVEYIHTDALGSPVAVTDANGVVIERTVYEPYGAVVGGLVKDGPGYTGHVSDSATGLSYMQQRYMDPEAGVFLSADPVTAQQGGNFQFNRYRYANGNPYAFVDPDGKDAFFFTDANVLVIPVYFTGPAATTSNIEAIRNRVNAISSEFRGFKTVLQVLSKPGGVGTNTMNLAPGKDYTNYPSAGEGVYGGVGGSTGHIDSSSQNWIGAATHDILHFAGAPDGYESNGSRENRTATYKDGYTDDHLMANRSGTRLRASDEDGITRNDTTQKLKLSDFKGVFRVEGRLDAKRLDRQFSGK
jgi:RHS repeat-associated protein